MPVCVYVPYHSARGVINRTGVSLLLFLQMLGGRGDISQCLVSACLKADFNVQFLSLKNSKVPFS